MANSIEPFLMFEGSAAAAMNFYVDQSVLFVRHEAEVQREIETP
jgi:predicted 3-demethylubiquinone-9 3-methyltransferase (glyoxalase superfamily)